MQSVKSIIRSRYDEFTSLPTQHDNQDFNRPGKQSWARATILTSDTERIDNRVARIRGVFIIQLFCRLGIGDKEITELADAFAGHFENINVDGVRFLTPKIETVGRTENYWQVNVTCPFIRDYER